MSSGSLPQQGHLPRGWKWATLSEIALINPPKRRNIPHNPDTRVTFVPMPSVCEDTGTITWPENRPLAEVSRGYTYFEEGDVLFAKITPCMQNGKHAIARGLANGFGFGTTEFHVIRPGDTVTADWIHRFLRQPWLLEEATRYFRGAVGQQRVPKEFLIDLRIPIPPLAEQKRIVAVLNEQMAAVECAKKAAEERLDAAQALREALLHSWFAAPTSQNWPLVTLGNLVQLRNEIVHPRDNPTGAATFVGLEHIASGTGKRLGHEYIEKSELTGRKPVFLKGDIVYGYLRPYLNKVWVGEFDGLCSVDQYVYKVDTNRVRPCFLASFMRSGIFLQRAPISESPGQLPRIRTQEVASVLINLPPLSVQKAIESSMLEQEEFVEALLNSLSVEKDSLDNITSALLRRAFSGEI